MSESRIKIEATKLDRPWINSSNNLDELFDQVVKKCKEKKSSLRRVTAEQSPAKRKECFSEEEFSRIDKASEWVRDYLVWHRRREEMGEPSGTQAFLDQLEEPLKEMDSNGKVLRRKRYHFPTAKTLRNWVKKFETSKLSLAGNYSACGRSPEIADTVLLAYICAHAMLPRHSVRMISEKMKKHEVLGKLKGTSTSTLRFWGKRIPEGEWDMLQYGEAAHYQSSYGGRPIPAEQPGDIIQIDAGQIKVWTQDNKGEYVYPYLMVAIDVRTRAYLGAIMTLKAPTTADTMMLLRSLLLPKATRFHQMLVLPKQVQFDNGSIFNNPSVRDGLLALNIDPHGIEVETPTSNSVVERGFRLIGDEFASLFVRYVKDRGTWGGIQDVPSVEFASFNQELDQWLHDYNFNRPHSFHGGDTPAKVWRDLTAGRLYRPDEARVKEAMTFKLDCAVNRNGAVEPVQGHMFDGEGVRAYVGQKLTVRVTPELDYNHVHALIGGEWVKLQSIHSSPALGKKMAIDYATYKTGLLVVRKSLEAVSGMPRTPRTKKGKQSRPHLPIPRTETTNKAVKHAIVKTPSAPVLASSINNEVFDLN